jgi:hypothetical protein
VLGRPARLDELDRDALPEDVVVPLGEVDLTIRASSLTA